jgi:branched-chain amino acid transport system permease protein
MLEQLINAVVLGSVLLLFSVGLSLAWGTLDVLNLAHGAIFVLGSYLAYQLGQSTSLPFVPVVVISMCGTGAAAVVVELVAFGPIRSRFASRRQAGLAVLVASLGAATVLEQLISNWTHNEIFVPSQKLFTSKEYQVGSLTISNIDVIIVVAAVVVAVGLQFLVSRTRQGRAVRALAYAPRTASLMGVNVRLLATATMFLSGALAGLAGLFLSFQISGMAVTSGDIYMLSAFAILVVGGVGSIGGAVVASYGLAVAETAVVAYGPSGYETGVAFALIFIFLLVRPRGLFARAMVERA